LHELCKAKVLYNVSISTPYILQTLKSTIFWDITLCSPLKVDQVDFQWTEDSTLKNHSCENLKFYKHCLYCSSTRHFLSMYCTELHLYIKMANSDYKKINLTYKLHFQLIISILCYQKCYIPSPRQFPTYILPF
jgi:hypothetical protein